MKGTTEGQEGIRVRQQSVRGIIDSKDYDMSTPEESMAIILAMDDYKGRLEAMMQLVDEVRHNALEEAALTVETKSVPLGHERRYFAKAIRELKKNF